MNHYIFYYNIFYYYLNINTLIKMSLQPYFYPEIKLCNNIQLTD